MKDLDIDKLLKRGRIENELELEQASSASRKLRLISKDDPSLREKRARLRELIYQYESVNWSKSSKISKRQIEESDEAELLVEQHDVFIRKRKKLIRSKISKYKLTQQEFGQILGHNSKSYISELMNGVSPFTLKDLVTISNLLKIDLNDLVFTSMSYKERHEIEAIIKKLNKPQLKLRKKEFAFG